MRSPPCICLCLFLCLMTAAAHSTEQPANDSGSETTTREPPAAIGDEDVRDQTSDGSAAGSEMNPATESDAPMPDVSSGMSTHTANEAVLSLQSLDILSERMGETITTPLQMELNRQYALLQDMDQKLEPPSMWEKIWDGIVVNTVWQLLAGESGNESAIATLSAIVGFFLVCLKLFFLLRTRSTSGLDYVLILYVGLMVLAMGIFAYANGGGAMDGDRMDSLRSDMQRLQRSLDSHRPGLAASDPKSHEMLSGKIDALRDQIGNLNPTAGLQGMEPKMAPELVSQLNAIRADTQSMLQTIQQQQQRMSNGFDDGATDGLQLFNTLLLLALIMAAALFWHRGHAI